MTDACCDLQPVRAVRRPRPLRVGADLDLTRPAAREHLASSVGHHHCYGNALARMQAQVALWRLVWRSPEVELASDAVRSGRINPRGRRHLPGRLSPR